MADEILVHIAAPTTRQNDDLYRSLASAYLDFKPCTTYKDGDLAEPSEQNQAPDGTLNHVATPGASCIDASGDTSISSTGKDSYGSFPSNLSFGAHAEGQEYLSSRPYHVSPDGSMPSMSRLARLDRSYLNWREKATPKGSVSREKKRARWSLDGEDEADTAFIEDSQLAVLALQSQLQDSYSTTDEDTDDGGEEGSLRDALDVESERVEEKKRISLDDNTSDQLDADETVDELQSPPPETPQVQRNGLEETSPNYGEDSPTLDFSFLQHGNNDDKSIEAVEASFSVIDFTQLSTDAFGPAPKISTSRPSSLPSQITASLSTLKTQNPTRFQPLEQRRTPEHDERGYWIVDCSQWPQKLQQEFWNSLHDQVSSGRTGWGTTLHRDAKSKGRLGLVRLFCWGEVVEHMWLLLWLCSQGKIAGTKTKWVDADGVAIFEVA